MDLRMLIFVLVTLAVTPTEGCEAHWEKFKESCYFAYQYQMYTYDEAKTVCAGKGGALLTINDVDENLYARGLTRDAVDMWIGLTYRLNEDEWRWDNGLQLSYECWARRERTVRHGTEDCVILSVANHGQWKAVDCSKHLGFICEKTNEHCNVVAVGVESGAIPDSQMTASSNFNAKHMSFQGRLNYQRPDDLPAGSSAWSSKSLDVGQWLQIDLGYARKIVRVATQGRADVYQWVKTFKLSYDDDGTWTDIIDCNDFLRFFGGMLTKTQ
ncbi:neurocan core protein-like [Ptychodera flava]|uniref:neurocan core protein-like n=1 Tax=Ptychodera flava TaxID=63121 RepID=UPI00396A3308